MGRLILHADHLITLADDNFVLGDGAVLVDDDADFVEMNRVLLEDGAKRPQVAGKQGLLFEVLLEGAGGGTPNRLPGADNFMRQDAALPAQHSHR